MSSTAEEFAGGFLYHVPQHSRREKLRFSADDSPAAAASSAALLYQSNATSFLPPSSCYSHSFDGCGPHQLQPQGFSLSLSPATVGPLGPFTGYAAVLNRSGFVLPAQQLLEDICRFGRAEFAGLGDRDLMEEDINSAMESEVERAGGVDEERWKKLKLVSMLDEVYRRYRLYQQQVETVIASFQTVAGLNTAAPYVSLALKSMSKSFRSLKNLISSQLNELEKANNGKEGLGKGELSGFGLAASGDHASSQRRNSSLTFGHTQVWRPQRGLPERAVSVLRAWLFEHFLHPYPTDTDKHILAKQTGLTRNQVSNWFINARVRLWKPMVEEIHNLEMHQLQKAAATDHAVQNSPFQASQPSSSSAATSCNRPHENNFMQRNTQSRSYHRPSNIELPRIEEPYRFVFDDDFAGHGQPIGVEVGGNSVVSLTLGLPEPLSMNVARRFGLEECSNAYVLGGFEGGQERHYGKEIGAHMLHDFVG